MYNKEEFLTDVRNNLEKQTATLIEGFKHIGGLKYSEKVHFLFVECVYGKRIEIAVTAFDNSFSQISNAKDGFAGILDLVEEFKLFKAVNHDNFYEFFEENDMENEIIIAIGKWVKKCFEEANIELPVPIYFYVHDEIDALNLLTGEWVNHNEIWD